LAEPPDATSRIAASPTRLPRERFSPQTGLGHSIWTLERLQSPWPVIGRNAPRTTAAPPRPDAWCWLANQVAERLLRTETNSTSRPSAAVHGSPKLP